MFDFEDIDPTEHDDVPRQLCLADLDTLMDDSHAGARRGEKASREHQDALVDVLMCGPMLRRVCDFTGHEPEVDASVILLADTSWREIRIAAAAGESRYCPELLGGNMR